MKKNQLALAVIIILTVLAMGSFKDLSGTRDFGSGPVVYKEELKKQQMNYKIMLVIAASALGYFAYTRIEE